MEDENRNKTGRIVSIDDAVIRSSRNEEEDSLYTKKIKRHSRIDKIAKLLLFLTVAGIAVYLLWIRRAESYNSIGMEWNLDILTSADQNYINFGGGILQYGPQGASYYTIKDKDTWAAGYTMVTPTAICQDGYALIYDRGSKNAIILSKDSGQVGTIAAAAPITKGTVSAYGAVALILEEDQSNTMAFFDNTGKTLDINVHTLMDQSGYPVDIAFSPDGQMVIASFIYLDSGVMQDQIVFYNFDEKRSATGVVGAFRKYGDKLFADVVYLNDNVAAAFGDGCVALYNLKNKTTPEEMKVLEFDKTITHVTYGSSGIVVITEADGLKDKHTLHCYDLKGEEVYSRDIEFDINSMSITENGVYVVSSNALLFLDKKGREYFRGSLECDIIKLNNTNEESDLLLITNQKAVYLKLFKG